MSNTSIPRFTSRSFITFMVRPYDDGTLIKLRMRTSRRRTIGGHRPRPQGFRTSRGLASKRMEPRRRLRAFLSTRRAQLIRER